MKQKPLKIAIRVDANNLIGGGHFMRCLSLAKEMQERKHKILLISSSLPVKMRQILTKLGLSYKIIGFSHKRKKIQENQYNDKYKNWLSIPKHLDARETIKVLLRFKPDWIILDNYALDFEWTDEVRKCLVSTFFLAIDDLDNRSLGAEFILDQTSLFKRKRKYKSLTVLEGPSFSLLAKNYREMREKSISERKKRLEKKDMPKIFSILICIGMYDTKEILPNLLKATAIVKNVRIDIAMSSDSQTVTEVKELTKTYTNVALHLDEFDISFLMLNADLCIGASGMSTWERCCLGLPSLTIEIASNQRKVIRDLKRVGAVQAITVTQARNKNYLFNTVSKLINFPEKLKRMSTISKDLCDGLGTKRVMDFLEAKLRPVQITDSDLLLKWRNNSFVRKMSFDHKIISKQEHTKWITNTQDPSKGIWLIYSEGNVEIGHCNCVFLSEDTVYWSFYLDQGKFSRGTGKRMLAFFLKELFHQKRVNKVKAKVLNSNQKSKEIHKHFGFICRNKFTEILTYTLSKRKFERQFYSSDKIKGLM